MSVSVPSVEKKFDPAFAVGSRIVLADGDPERLAELCQVLGGAYRIEVAEDGLKALSAIQREKPALLLASVSLPGLDGLGLLRRIRLEPGLTDLPIILMSAQEYGSEAAALRAGADDHITWPFHAEGLLARVAARSDVTQGRKDSFRSLAAILDSIGDSFVALDRNWKISFVNQSFLRLVAPLYQGPEDLIGYELWERFPGLRDREAGRRYRAAMESQTPDYFEIFYEPLQVWLEVRVRPSPDSLGIYAHDVTERRRAEQAVHASEERYKTLFDSIDEGFCVLEMLYDENGKAGDYRFIETNPAFEKQTGLQHAVGRRMLEIASDHEKHWFEIYGRVASTGEPIRFINEARELDARWFDVYAFRLGGKESRKVAVLFTDITESKLSSLILERRNELLALLSEAAHELLAATNPRDMVRQLFYLVARRLKLDVFFNFMVDESGTRLRLEVAGGVDEQTQGALAHLNFGQAVCGTVAQDKQRIVVRDVQGCNFDKAQGVKQMGVRAYACHPLFVGERLIGTLSFGSRSRDAFEDDELEFMQTIASYVAMAKERLRVEEERETALCRERDASLAKDHFLAVLSHELRTPLTPVLMTAAARELDPDLSPEVRRDMNMIRRNVELETKLIDDLLDVSRITSGKLSLNVEPLDLNSAVQHVCGICHPQFLEKKIQLHCDLDPVAGQIAADPARLRQVLWNLLKNAVKFTPAGGDIFVTTRVLPSGRRQVQVRDTGIGIAQEALVQIFDAFEQGGIGITQQFGGLGLGLAISKALVELHQGSIRAESVGTGQGSTFTVEWPASEALGEAAIPEVKESSETTSARVRLLIVEDHVDTALTLRLLLTHVGYHVQTADNAARALDLASRETFDIMVSDLGLPDASGYELMKQIRDRHALKGIAMSGYGMEEDMRKSREAGFSDHLVKPVDVERLHQVIQRVVAGN